MGVGCLSTLFLLCSAFWRFTQGMYNLVFSNKLKEIYADFWSSCSAQPLPLQYSTCKFHCLRLSKLQFLSSQCTVITVFYLGSPSLNHGQESIPKHNSLYIIEHGSSFLSICLSLLLNIYFRVSFKEPCLSYGIWCVITILKQNII